METRVRIRVRDVEIEVVGEDDFVTNRWPNLVSDLMSRLSIRGVPVIPPAPLVVVPPVDANLVSIGGDIRDYWTEVPVAGVRVTTIGLAPNLTDVSDEAGRFIMSGRIAGERCSLLASGLAGYAETITSVELSTGPTTVSVFSVAAPDVIRQYMSLGLVRVPGTTIIIVDLLDVGGAPLEMVPASDITLTDTNGVPIGSGPFFFGANGDIQPVDEMSLSRAFADRARAAFINVPNGDFSFQVTRTGAGGALARAVVAVHAAGGATVLRARLPA